MVKVELNEAASETLKQQSCFFLSMRSQRLRDDDIFTFNFDLPGLNLGLGVILDCGGYQVEPKLDFKS